MSHGSIGSGTLWRRMVPKSRLPMSAFRSAARTKRKVERLGKKVNALTRIGTEATSISNSAFVANFNGVADTSTLDVAAGFSSVLTTLAAGSGVQQRDANVVQFSRLKGHLSIYLPGTSLYTNGPTPMRAIILRVNKMRLAAGVYTHPIIDDVLFTNATTTVSDMWAGVAPDQIQANRRDRNYKIVWDRRFILTSTSPGNGQRSGAGVELKYNIKVPSGYKTTYNGNANSIDVCAQNHYILYIFGTNAQVATDIPIVDFYGQTIFYV